MNETLKKLKALLNRMQDDVNWAECGYMSDETYNYLGEIDTKIQIALDVIKEAERK